MRFCFVLSFSSRVRHLASSHEFLGTLSRQSRLSKLVLDSRNQNLNQEQHSSHVLTIASLTVWIGGWMLAWSTTLEGILSRPTNENRFDLSRFPLVVNSFSIAVPVLFISSLVTLTGVAHFRWMGALVVCVAFDFRCEFPLIPDFAVTINSRQISTLQWLDLSVECFRISSRCKECERRCRTNSQQ